MVERAGRAQGPSGAEREAGVRRERAPSRSSPTPPKVIGRYQIGRLLGEGAMGRVYLATDPELGREVAIKVLRLDAAGSARDAYIARFRNEARAAAKFMHPNVVAVYDAGVDPTLGPYLVYEYVAGQTLRGRISAGPIEPAELVRIARGVGAALDALHAAEIIHRDIKPDNILLAPDGGVKLTDFGIARVPDAALTRDGQFLGTPAYASPEAITRGEYSARGDVFSFAAVLYECLCGVRPFPGDDAVAVSYAVAHDTPPAPSRHVPSIPATVDVAFARAFAKKITDRYASAGELAATLHQAFRNAAANGASAPSVASTTVPLQALKRPQHAPSAVMPMEDGAVAVRPARPVIPAVIVAVLLASVAWWITRRNAAHDGDDPSATPVVHPVRPTTPVPTAPSVVRPPRYGARPVAPRVHAPVAPAVPTPVPPRTTTGD